MDASTHLPQPVRQAQKSLQPYIKQRKEAALIRRILASHLNSHLDHKDGSTLSRPLALLDSASDLSTSDPGVKGLQKEYLRCARANIKAKKEFVSISKEHTEKTEEESTAGIQTLQFQDGSVSSTDSFLNVVKHRQKHERLRIIQDYVDVLCQKPAASSEHLDPRLVLKDVDSLPAVPSEVFDGPGVSQSSSGNNLAALVDQLEKSVLRAKILLRNEQKLLEKVKHDNGIPSAGFGGRLQALGSTRNELISWIETELTCAGDTPSAFEDREMPYGEGGGKDYIDAHLASIHRQYSRYAKARQRLILAVTGLLEAPLAPALEGTTALAGVKELYRSTGAHITFPFLEQMVAISNDQKALIQQKAHLTTSLAKQIKETNQGLDRLAEESHLLPSHPMPTSSSQSKRKESTISFGDEISHHEKPESSRRAAAWVFAGASAGKANEASISGTLEEGLSIVESIHGTLQDLQRILGNGAELRTDVNSDIWTGLDGTFGVIKADGVD